MRRVAEIVAVAALCAACPKQTQTQTPPVAGLLYRDHASAVVVLRATAELVEGAVEVHTANGVVLEGGRILTVCHLLRPEEGTVDRVEVIVGPGGGSVHTLPTYRVEEVRCDEQLDLALLRVTDDEVDLTAVSGSLSVAADDPAPGGAVFSLGMSAGACRGRSARARRWGWDGCETEPAACSPRPIRRRSPPRSPTTGTGRSRSPAPTTR